MTKTEVTQRTLKAMATDVISIEDKGKTSYTYYVNLYRSFAKKSAENFIKLAETVVVAERKLSPTEFVQFCDAVRLNPNSSTHRKIKTIGQNAARFKVVLDQLPNNWTTLYGLAALPNEQFDAVVSSGHLTPLATAKELMAIVAPNKKSAKKGGKRLIRGDLIVDLQGLAIEQKLIVYRKIVELSDEFSFRVAPSRELSDLFEGNSLAA